MSNTFERIAEAGYYVNMLTQSRQLTWYCELRGERLPGERVSTFFIKGEGEGPYEALRNTLKFALKKDPAYGKRKPVQL
jgi:hypothetical protein